MAGELTVFACPWNHIRICLCETVKLYLKRRAAASGARQAGQGAPRTSAGGQPGQCKAFSNQFAKVQGRTSRF